MKTSRTLYVFINMVTVDAVMVQSWLRIHLLRNNAALHFLNRVPFKRNKIWYFLHPEQRPSRTLSLWTWSLQQNSGSRSTRGRRRRIRPWGTPSPGWRTSSTAGGMVSEQILCWLYNVCFRFFWCLRCLFSVFNSSADCRVWFSLGFSL